MNGRLLIKTLEKERKKKTMGRTQLVLNKSKGTLWFFR